MVGLRVVVSKLIVPMAGLRLNSSKHIMRIARKFPVEGLGDG